MNESEVLLQQVERATTAADLFGAPSSDTAARRRARRTQRVLALHLHPDRPAAGLDPSRATAAFVKATGFYEVWTREAEGGTAGALRGRRGSYRLGGLVGQGTVANLYDVAGADAVVKLARRPASSRFLLNERTALRALGELTATRDGGWLAPYFPRLIDTATVVDPATQERREANVLGSLTRADGFYSLAQVRQAVPDGLDGRDWAWMQRRLLRALAGAHEAGVVHGAVLPENVLIHPREHGVVLAGWSFATRPGHPPQGRVASQAAAYPPEATAPGGVLTPASDVAMLGALALTMLRPDEQAQRRFATGCRQTAPGMRPRAADLLGEYDELLEDLYGARRFRPFDLAV